MLGRFDHSKNCSVPHFLPQGMMKDGLPVIIFPKNQTKAVVGKLYDFEYTMTMSATFTIDGQVYRVAHAWGLMDTEMKEGDMFDQIFHSKAGPAVQSTIADRMDPELRERLLALKPRT